MRNLSHTILAIVVRSFLAMQRGQYHHPLSRTSFAGIKGPEKSTTPYEERKFYFSSECKDNHVEIPWISHQSGKFQMMMITKCTFGSCSEVSPLWDSTGPVNKSALLSSSDRASRGAVGWNGQFFDMAWAATLEGLSCYGFKDYDASYLGIDRGLSGKIYRRDAYHVVMQCEILGPQFQPSLQFDCIFSMERQTPFSIDNSNDKLHCESKFTQRQLSEEKLLFESILYMNRIVISSREHDHLILIKVFEDVVADLAIREMDLRSKLLVVAKGVLTIICRLNHLDTWRSVPLNSLFLLIRQLEYFMTHFLLKSRDLKPFRDSQSSTTFPDEGATASKMEATGPLETGSLLSIQEADLIVEITGQIMDAPVICDSRYYELFSSTRLDSDYISRYSILLAHTLKIWSQTECHRNAIVQWF